MIALAAVIALALIARLVDIQNVEFFHDEAMVAMMAQEMADGLTFPLQGILSSVGIPNPPTSIYVMAVPYVFTNNPVVVTAFIALRSPDQAAGSLGLTLRPARIGRGMAFSSESMLSRLDRGIRHTGSRE